MSIEVARVHQRKAITLAVSIADEPSATFLTFSEAFKEGMRIIGAYNAVTIQISEGVQLYKGRCNLQDLGSGTRYFARDEEDLRRVLAIARRGAHIS